MKPDDAATMEQIMADERAQSLVAELWSKRLALPMTNMEFYRLVRTHEYLDSKSFIGLIETTLATASVTPSGSPLPVILSGIVPEPRGLLETLDRAGAVVAGDDTACCGRRIYPPGTSSDVYTRCAQRILNAPPDSTRGSPLRDRLDHLLRLARSCRARGVVFVGMQFCEVEQFDLPFLCHGLKAEGIDSIVVETDLKQPFGERAVTRIEAFLEVLR